MKRKMFFTFLFVAALMVIQPATGLAKAPVNKSLVVIVPSVAKNKQSMSMQLKNLQKTSSIMYSLQYTQNGKAEGAGGTINTKGKYSLSRKLLFGTCSAGVCKYHKNIKNAVLTVVITYKNGSTVTKTFKLRV